MFERVELLVGRNGMEEIARRKVIIFGIGGVGSWCAESLVRTGIRNLTIVDYDLIVESNVNRQLHATAETMGLSKTEALGQRLLAINPDISITMLQRIYNAETHDSFELDKYDYIIDAIDTIHSKVHLIREATRTGAVFFSSMGAALKFDPLQIRVADFWKVRNCPLGSRLRKMVRKGKLPGKNFLCVYSEEKTDTGSIHTGTAVINGTVVHVTAVFGFTLAGLVINDIISASQKPDTT